VALGDGFLDAHRSDQNRAVSVAEGQTYALVRPGGETFVLGIGELSQNADRKNRQLELSMFPIGKIPWGARFCVVDTQGKPVAGATATFSISERIEKVDGVATYQTHSPETFRSDAQGCIQLPRLPRDAKFRGEVAAPGFFTRKDVDGFRDKDGHYFPPGVDGKVQLKRPGAISGQVLGPDGKPLVHAPLSLDTLVEYPHGAVATANHLRAVSDDNGRFLFEGVPPGNHHLYYPWSGPTQGEVDSGRWKTFEIKKDNGRVVPLPLAGYGMVRPITVDEGATVRNVTLDFTQSTSTIEGKVLDAEGKPLKGASVRVLWRQGRQDGGQSLLPDVVSDVEGRYHVDHLPPGPYQLQTIPPGMKVAPGTASGTFVGLAAHQVMRLDLRLATAENAP
jgi:hypothetical protein